jgi:hypothetical protein
MRTQTLQLRLRIPELPRCGALIIGQFADLGFSQHGASYSIIDYSTKTTDSQGRVTITDGPYANKLDVDVVLDTAVFGVARNISNGSANYSGAVWIAEENNRNSGHLRILPRI